MHRLNDPSYVEDLRQLLDRLEELAPVIRRSRFERLLARFRNTMAVVALAGFILAGVAIYRIGDVGQSATHSARQEAAVSRKIADCINTVLALRSVVGRPDAFLNTVLDRAASTPVTDADANRAAYRELNRARSGRATSSDFFQTLIHAQRALDANEAFRHAHPLGRC